MTDFRRTRLFIYLAGTLIDPNQNNPNEDTIYEGHNSSHEALSGHGHSEGAGDGGKLAAPGTTSPTFEIGRGSGTALNITKTSTVDRIWSHPDSDDTYVGLTSTQTLTNKTLQDPTITGTVAGAAGYTGITATDPTITGTVAGAASYTGITATDPTITGTVAGAAIYTTPTLITPIISDFTNANHSHTSAGTGGTIAHSALTGLGNDDHTQYVKADGSRAFTGTVGGVSPTASSHLATKGYVDGELVTDHGALTGLGDDDHTQYVKTDGTRSFTGTVSGVSPTASSHLATKGYVDGELVTDHGALTGLGDDDHPQYPKISAPETITGPWDFTGSPIFQSSTTLGLAMLLQETNITGRWHVLIGKTTSNVDVFLDLMSAATGHAVAGIGFGAATMDGNIVGLASDDSRVRVFYGTLRNDNGTPIFAENASGVTTGNASHSLRFINSGNVLQLQLQHGNETTQVNFNYVIFVTQTDL